MKYKANISVRYVRNEIVNYYKRESKAAEDSQRDAEPDVEPVPEPATKAEGAYFFPFLKLKLLKKSFLSFYNLRWNGFKWSCSWWCSN